METSAQHRTVKPLRANTYLSIYFLVSYNLFS
nr:MAG TPA: hypothetical protein [Caudoviricetes sp.]